MKSHVRARQYGGVLIELGTCSLCGDRCMICKDGTSSCCGVPTAPYKTGSISKESSCIGHRTQPSRSAQKQLLKEQDDKCYWCGREFHTYVLSPKGNLVELKPVWDHYIPFVYTQTNTKTADAFVASCSRCNSHKGAKVIYSLEDEVELREILKRRWYHGGWTDLTADSNGSL